MTQTQLAELAGTDQSIISKIEKGSSTYRITDDMKWRLAGALRCTVDELFPWPAVCPPFPEARREQAVA